LVTLKDGGGLATNEGFTRHIVEEGGFAHTEATEVAQYLPYCPFVYIAIADVLLWYSSNSW
jgi:hypothetical protein